MPKYNNQDAAEYLNAYRNNQIKGGYKLGIDLDDYYQHKDGEFTIVNGLDGVGKTDFMLWFFLCHSMLHDKKWCIWSGENKSQQLIRKLISFKTGKRLTDLTEVEVYNELAEISNYFEFIDINQMYKFEELSKEFKDSDADGFLIDPFTGLNRGFTPADNYEFLNLSREFVNTTGKSLYTCTHPNTEAARRHYPKDHDFEGYPMPPLRSQSEGGQPFANRPDNYLTLHRLSGHPQVGYMTWVFARKIADTETGGKVSAIDSPVNFNYNGGLGFTCGGVNPINNTIEESAFLNIQPNNDFDEQPF